MGIYLLKVNNRNSRTRCEMCSKLTMKTTELRIVNFEHISHLVVVFLFLTLNMQLRAGRFIEIMKFQSKLNTTSNGSLVSFPMGKLCQFHIFKTCKFKSWNWIDVFPELAYFCDWTFKVNSEKKNPEGSWNVNPLYIFGSYVTPPTTKLP